MYRTPLFLLLIYLLFTVPFCTALYLNIPKARPDPIHRLFNSTEIELLIHNISSIIAFEPLSILFQNCFPNTLDTTVVVASRNDSFVITGDINALWLRDSSNQVFPYIPHAVKGSNLEAMLQGLVLRHLRSVTIDSYANAFNQESNGNGHQTDIRTPPMQPSVFEGKYEVDSLCSTILLCYLVTNSSEGSGLTFLRPHATLWVGAMSKILTTFQQQQESTEQQNGTFPYMFQRPSTHRVYPLPGETVAYTGMVRSAFRPSDDETKYDFLLPSNFYATAVLPQLIWMTESAKMVFDPEYSQLLENMINSATVLLQEITTGLANNVVVNGVTAYEVDGVGHANFMDDANSPNLLNLPGLGVSYVDYPAVRSWVLSPKNPFYFIGSAARGVGSPHTGPNMIWPMSLTQQALTSNNWTEVTECLEMLLLSANNTGFMHESFNKDDVSDFTRPWFAWANTLFGSLVTHLYEINPQFLKTFKM